MFIKLRHTVVLAGLAILPATSLLNERLVKDGSEPQVDPRIVKLRAFFLDRQAPILHLAEDFIRAADEAGLDWRLLPSIAVVESSGGKHYHNNNIFGWNNGRLRFRSIHASIYEVARSMGSMRCYRGKDLDAILWTYNPIHGYNLRIKTAMRALDPDFDRSVAVQAAARVN